MNRTFECPALDVPGVGRLTLFARKEQAVRVEAETILLAIVTSRAISLIGRITDGDVTGLAQEMPMAQCVGIYDGDKLVGELRPGGPMAPAYTVIT